MNIALELEYIAANYGHILTRNAEITGNELAIRIGELYDTAEPHNHYVVEVVAEIGGIWSRKVSGELNWRK